MESLACLLLPLVLSLPSVLAVLLVRKAAGLVERWQLWLLGAVSLFVIAVGLLAAFTISFIGLQGFLPPGVILAFSTFCAGITGLVAALLTCRVFRGQERARKMFVFVLVGCILIPGTFLLSTFGFLIINPHCDRLNRQTGEQIVSAIESYHQDHGVYPGELGVLVPDYLSAVPSDRCDPFGQRYYELRQCPEDLVLTVHTMDLYQYQRYNLTTGQWSRTPSADWLEVWTSVCWELE